MDFSTYTEDVPNSSLNLAYYDQVLKVLLLSMFNLDQLTVLIYTTREFCFDMLLTHGGGPMGTKIQKLKGSPHS